MKWPERSSPNNSPKHPVDLIPSDYAREFLKKAPLPRRFFLRDTALVAQDLLGKALLVKQRRQILIAEIVEVEAYLGHSDPASHAYRGPTKRNWPMFEEGGTCYVYFSYGAHFCMNVTTREKGQGEAVLLRALSPVFGVETMKKNRMERSLTVSNLTNGPGRLTKAFGIDLTYNGFTFNRPDFKLVDLGKTVPAQEVGKSPRIGISRAADWELRFFLKSSPWLSRRKVF